MEEKIIEFMRENNFMHNINSTEYKNLKEKEKKWQELSSELGITVSEIKRKWKTLKNGFYREEQRLNAPSGSGSSNGPKWKYYDDLTFLRGSKKRRTTASDEDLFDDIIEEVDDATDSSAFAECCLGNDENTDLDDSAFSLNASSSAEQCGEPSRKRRGNRIDKEAISKSAEEKLDQISKTIEKKCNKEKSAMTTFFESMAITVEEAKLPIEEILQIQEEVLKIVASRITAYKNKTQNQHTQKD